MKTILITFLVLITPALVALGYDYYRFHTADEELERTFMMAEIGWLWVDLHEDSHDSAVEAVGEEMWKEFVNPIMKQVAALIFALPALLVFTIMMTMKTFGFGPYEGEGLLTSKGQKVSAYSSKGLKTKSGKTKYKRK